MRRLALAPFLLVAFWPMSAVGQGSPCEDTVNCLCDTAPMQDASIILCEDFENAAYDIAGVNVEWNKIENYGADTAASCGAAAGEAVEGTATNACFNIVTEATCDVVGQTDCVLDGNQSLGAKYEQGQTYAIFGKKSFSPAMADFGITNVIKFSANFDKGASGGFKHTEWNYWVQSFHWGQDVSSHWDRVYWKSSGGGTTNPVNDFNWETKIFFVPTQINDVRTATVNKGYIFSTNAGTINWRPWGEEFPGGSFNWPQDTWACLRTKFTGMGTATATLQQWWQQENHASETLIIDISNLDLSPSGEELRLNAIAFNNYFNGSQGTDSFACGYGSLTNMPCTYENPSLTRAYRYEDNYVVTNGDPVSCADVRFYGSAATPTPSGTPTTSPTPTISPTTGPTGTPTVSPTISPTGTPTGTPTVSPTAAPTPDPAEATVTLDDPFINPYAWLPRSNARLTCGWSGEELVFNAEHGVCHYASDAGDGATDPPGSQPGSYDQWGVFEFGSVESPNVGIALRLQAGVGDPGVGVFNYAMRCSGDDITIRNCEEDAICATIAAGGSCDYADGDQMGFIVAGTGVNTELCGYHWAIIDEDPTDWGNPTTWGDADFCTSADGSIVTLAAFTGGGTVIQDWHDWDPVNPTGPDDLYGFPLVSQTDVGMYSGWDVAWSVEWMMAGDLESDPAPTAAPTPTPTISPTTGPTGTPTITPTPTVSPTVSPTTSGATGVLARLH